jgi:hypothetical protein
VEHTKSEEKSLELWELMRLGFLELRFVELGEGSTQVRLKILRSLISNLNRVLHDGLRDDLLIWQRWWLS